MRKLLFLIPILVSFSTIAQVQKLGRMVTNSVEHEKAPVISADGKHMIFMIKGSHGRGWLVNYSAKNGKSFSRGKGLNELNKMQKLNLMGGYCLTVDGSELYFTTKKHGGIGGYDIWKAKRNSDGTFGSFESLGKPLNSNSNDGMPSISADGQFMYFVRSSSMDDVNNIQGEIWMSQKKGSRWGTPQKLPFSAEYSFPKIFVNNKYLLLTKGKRNQISLWFSKFENGQWQIPKEITSLTGKINQPFTSITHNEKVVYFSAKGESSSDLFRAILAENERPNPVVLFRVMNEKTSEKSRVIISDLQTQNQEIKKMVKPSTSFYLDAGKKYDVYVQNLAKDELFHHEIYDATSIQKLTLQKRSFIFLKIAENDTLNMTNYVDELTNEISFDSPQKAKQLAIFMNQSPFMYKFIKEELTSVENIEANQDKYIDIFLKKLIEAGLKTEKYKLEVVKNDNPTNEIKIHVVGKL